jgi:hypothetical protein
VQRHFLEQVQRDYFNAGFDRPADVLYLLVGLLSEASRRHVERGMRRLAAEIDELSKQDARLPREERSAFGAVVALRPWEYSMITALRRPPTADKPEKRARR